MLVSMCLSLPHSALDIFATGNVLTLEVIRTRKFFPIFIFMELKKPLNRLKNRITETEENLNKIVKHCLK